MTRNLVPPETAQHNREHEGGGYTFNAFPPDDYEGILFVVVALRLGDHAHLEISSGWHTPQPHSRAPSLHYGKAGHLILRWPEWLALREIFDADDRFRIAEVERPTKGQLEFHLPNRRSDVE